MNRRSFLAALLALGAAPLAPMTARGERVDAALWFMSGDFMSGDRSENLYWRSTNNFTAAEVQEHMEHVWRQVSA